MKSTKNFIDGLAETARTFFKQQSGATRPGNEAGGLFKKPSLQKPSPLPDFVNGLFDRLGIEIPDGLKNGADRDVDVPPRETNSESNPGQFLSFSYTNQAGTRAYKLYVPSCYADDGNPLPLVVMLHGCTQHPEDFAKGTRMNKLAEEKRCLVAYPEQMQSANASRCWNWFNSIDQQRGMGEPSIIAGITREIMERYRIDSRLVYVAGLSAGGAMAIIMGTTYPELFAAVGVHSGLPYAAARDLPSALAAMKGNAAAKRKAANSQSSKKSEVRLHTIVFHGDKDQTVHPRNGDAVIDQTVADSQNTLQYQGTVPGGHAFTQTIHQDANGHPIAEQWLIHGAGHAWSGGSKSGSYTDPRGPDATTEMLRFFYTQSCQLH